jgi:leucyl aminopeptidase (aminopeptidase T)
MSATMVATSYDPVFVPGARNAIRTCLRVEPRERVALVTDVETREIAASLADQVRELGSPLDAFVLEDFGPRPMFEIPARITAALEEADVTIFCAQPKPGELAMRRALTAIVNRRQIRHAHMVSISPRIMVEGMRADYAEVDAISERVFARAKAATKIRARSRAGSDLEATFDPRIRWLKTSGLITRSKWANLPAGEVLTSPSRVDGVYVVDGVIGDYLCARHGDLQATPLSIRIAESRFVSASCERREVLEDFVAYVRSHENGDRVGEFAIGTNTGVRSLIGNILQDEKIPGLHLAFGHPYAEHTGADWSCPNHIDVVGRHFDIWIDGEQVMADGAFLI